MRGIGCLLAIAIIAALIVEGWVVDLVAHLLGDAMDLGGPEYLSAMLAVIALSIIGFRLIKRRIAQLPLVMMGGGDFGRIAVGVVGCALMVFPGFISGAIGLVLQIPACQGLFGKAAGKVVAAFIRQAAQRMGQGGMPGGFPGGGMPGGFPGGGGMPGGFPGNLQGLKKAKGDLKPDQKQRGKRTFDVKNEG